MNTLLSFKNILPARKSVSRQFAKGLLLTTAACVILGSANGQADKRLVQAEQYFAAGDYYTAAHLYGQFLKPSTKTKSPSDFPLNANRNAEGRTGKYGTRTDVLFKQAESYRLANYWPEATALYKECFQQDSSKYAAALYWLAVCQRSTGHFAAAEESIRLFLNNYAAGNSLLQEAEKEKQSLKFIDSQLGRPDAVLYKISKIQSPFGKQKGVFAPAGNGSEILFTSTGADSVAAGQNPYHNRLFTATLNNGNVQQFQPLVIQGMDLSANQGAASASADGNRLYFTQWKKENGQMISAIYMTEKTLGGWTAPRLMTSLSQQGSNNKQPYCSADGRYLFFASDRNGGNGGFDIWYAPLMSDGTTGTPVNVGNINSPGNEQAPFFHAATGSLVFASDRIPGMGGYDLFVSKGQAGEWSYPENMGYPVNSSRDDLYFFSNGKDLMTNAWFSSDRGSECCLATYSLSKTPKKQMLTGLVVDCETSEPLADAEITMTDTQGKTLTTKTASDGRYRFEFSGAGLRRLSVIKDEYLDKTSDLTVDGKNENEWHTDTFYSTTVCLEKKRLVIKVENVVTVYFDFDRSNIRERARVTLDSIYQVMVEDSTANIQISGYTDGLGSAEYNAKLSDKRARSCADYLIGKGIDPMRISFESFGACCPVEMELINGRDNPDGRSMNRRALINIDKKVPE